MQVQLGGGGAAIRVRLSISALVELDDCRQVLSDEEVGLELHFELEARERGIVRREEQVRAYSQQLRKAFDQHVIGKSRFQSVHIFAAVPVSIAFRLGQALTATGLRACYIYNYDGEESPRYKWRLCLQAADSGQRSVEIFQEGTPALDTPGPPNT